MINGSRFDLVDENRPFIGTAPMPRGHALYPADLTRAEIERYVAAHPAQKNEIYRASRRSSVVKAPTLTGSPYHDEFREFMAPAADALRRAAALADDPAFADISAAARRCAASRTTTIRATWRGSI